MEANMSETCERCGLEMASTTTRNLVHAGELVRASEYFGKCLFDISCWQRGYDRAKARAEKAEAALAAARRECEGLKTLLREVRPLVHETFLAAGPMSERGWEAFLARINAALAAPAAGEEG